MADITLKNISKVYPGEVTAVKNFDLDVKDKEFIVLVGPSGCGKSTVLRMIAGLEEITEGELYIDNILVNYMPPKDRDIAMVFQNYALYPHMTIYKNMAFGLELRKVPPEVIKQKVKEVAGKLELEPYLNRKPKALSGGQRQRVALGRAMVREPKAFLLDEPLSNLDAKLRASMRSEITKLHFELGTTFIYVTHDQVEAMTMGDRIVVMKDGIIQQVNTPQNLYQYPCNQFVAGFIGSPQMNFIDTVLMKKDDDYVIDLGGEKYVLPRNDNREQLSNYIGKKVVFGVRPEDLDINREVNSFEIAKECTVELSELMGAEAYMYLDCDFCNHSITARVPSKKHTVHGTKVKLIIDLNKIYLFDSENEKTICCNK